MVKYTKENYDLLQLMKELKGDKSCEEIASAINKRGAEKVSRTFVQRVLDSEVSYAKKINEMFCVLADGKEITIK